MLGFADSILVARGHQTLPGTARSGFENGQKGGPKHRRKWANLMGSLQQRERRGEGEGGEGSGRSKASSPGQSQGERVLTKGEGEHSREREPL